MQIWFKYYNCSVILLKKKNIALREHKVSILVLEKIAKPHAHIITWLF